MLTEITDNSAVDLLLNDALNVGAINNWENAPFIDGPDTDPTNWGKKKHKGKHRNKCYFKFGIYTNANTI